jgi:hypothetical protein
MRVFLCDQCETPVFFENFQCVRCGHALAYLPEISEVSALEPEEGGTWRPLAPAAKDRRYRLCQNYSLENICNWAIPVDEPSSLCRSCRLTRVIPGLTDPSRRDAWFALEVAKRRLVYTLLNLGLPVVSKLDDAARGLTFEFLADPEPAQGSPGSPAPNLTGHVDGVITINAAEADDAERERRRLAVHEPYRTLLGHFRHEVGHYYWDRLIRDANEQDRFRELFGDERQDYAQSLARHYQHGPPADWPARFVSAYASAHPWEDWAETWAHYLHITDTLEMASDCGLSLRPARADMLAARPHFSLRMAAGTPFEVLVNDWLAVTYILNNLSRGLGQKDLYPFVLSDTAIAKLGFVHSLCTAARSPVLPSG